MMNYILIIGQNETETNILIYKDYLNIMKTLKLYQIHSGDELDINKWPLWDPNKYLIDKKLIKKISKNYLNMMKNLKLDQIYAHDKLDVNNWT